MKGNAKMRERLDITDQIISRWLTGKGLRATSDISQYGFSKLKAALKDGTGKNAETIDLSWCVKQFVRLAKSPAVPGSARLEAVRELKELVKLAALQDPAFLKHVETLENSGNPIGATIKLADAFGSTPAESTSGKTQKPKSKAKSA